MVAEAWGRCYTDRHPLFLRRLPPASRCRHGGFVRVIRALSVARVAALLLGLGVSFSAIPAESAQKRTSNPHLDRPEAGVFRHRLESSPSPARPRPRYRPGPRAGARPRAARGDDARDTRPTRPARSCPDVRAAAAIVFNPETGQVLWEENAQDKRSIASITKVMTALVFLERRAGSVAGSHRRARRHLRGVDHLSPRERADHARQSPAPDAHRLRQRRRPRAGARLARRAARPSSSG